MMLLRRSRWGLPLAAGTLIAACSGGSGVGGEAPLPTRMVVQPADFLGSTPCLQADGAMRSYQVTLLDVTDDLPGQPIEAPFALPTSSVVPCEVAVGFQHVVPGHRYMALVAGFTQEPGALRQPAPGFPAVVDEAGLVVAPRWTTLCHGTAEALATAFEGPAGLGGAGGAGGEGGTGAGAPAPRGALAVLNAQIPVRGCESLTDAGGSPTGILVNLEGARVGLSCGPGPDQIESFVVDHPTLPPGSFSAACADSVAVAPLPAAQEVEVFVTAMSAAAPDSAAGMGGAGGAAPVDPPRSWVTRCRARTAPGTLVPASCEPLVPFDPR